MVNLTNTLCRVLLAPPESQVGSEHYMPAILKDGDIIRQPSTHSGDAQMRTVFLRLAQVN